MSIKNKQKKMLRKGKWPKFQHDKCGHQIHSNFHRQINNVQRKFPLDLSAVFINVFAYCTVKFILSEIILNVYKFIC